MSTEPTPVSARRRAARVSSGAALFGAFAATIKLLRWLLLGLVAIYLCSGITRIAPNEDALIYRFGRLQREVHPPGLLFALPAPIDRVVRVPTRTQHELFLNAWSPDEAATSGATTPPAATTTAAPMTSQMPALLAAMLPQQNNSLNATVPTGKGLHPVYDGYSLTGDANIIQARFTARYRIVDPLAYVSAAAPADISRLIDAAVFDAATRTLAGIKVDDALGSGLESLRSRVRDAAQQRVDAMRLGIELVAFEVNALTPPQATVSAFAEVTSAQVEARTTVEQARTYRAQIQPRSQSDAYRIRQQADADARQVASKATGEAGSFLALLKEHRSAPTLFEARLRAEALEEVLPKVKTKTVLPSEAGQLNLFLRDNK